MERTCNRLRERLPFGWRVGKQVTQGRYRISPAGPAETLDDNNLDKADLFPVMVHGIGFEIECHHFLATVLITSHRALPDWR
jgi:hypothetical protein